MRVIYFNRLIDHLPDEVSWDEIMYELYVRQKIEQGLADIDADRTVPREQIKAKLLGMTIRWSPRARSDIRDLQKYIAKD